MKIINKNFIKLLAILLLYNSVGCNKIIDVKPPVTSISGASVYNSDATAAAVLTGLYTSINSLNSNQVSLRSISLFAGLSSDELVLFSGISNSSQIAYYKNTLSVNTGGFELWNLIYPYIFTCNSAIEGINSSTTLTQAVKQQLLGEAKFMRAFLYYYLVNLYGDVPLAVTTDFKVNSVLSRSAKPDVYQQIIYDLKDAQGLLSDKYLDASVLQTTNDRVRPTKWAAGALLARMYLLKGDYTNAELESTNIINNSIYGLTTLDNVFLKNSTEAIFQFQPVNTGWNTEDGKMFMLTVAPVGLNSTHPVYLSNFLLNSFEPGDNRKSSWTNSYTNVSGTYFFPYKYKKGTANSSVTEYQMVLRLAEQYLIRAEAKARLGKIAEAQLDLNKIRNRAGLANTGANDQLSLLNSISHERQVELFTEWGDRWINLKRTNAADAVMSVVTPTKGGTWQSTDQLFPIPLNDLQKNPNLFQNSGY